jgi:hypothetical protein
MKRAIPMILGGLVIGMIIGACGIHLQEQPGIFLAIAVPWSILWAIFVEEILN